MNGEVENLILERLRRLDQWLENIENDIHELKIRATTNDEHMSGMFIATSGINSRLDRIEERLGCVERRLDLTDAK